MMFKPCECITIQNKKRRAAVHELRKLDQDPPNLFQLMFQERLPSGRLGVVGGRPQREGIYVLHTADSLCYTAETNTAL